MAQEFEEFDTYSVDHMDGAEKVWYMGATVEW